MKYLLGVTFILFLSCSKKIEQKNQDLYFFKDKYLTELGNDDYENDLKKTKLKIKTDYIDDLIIVSNYVESNACGKYTGNIRIENDEIYLIYKLVSDEVCTSTSINKVTYVINNPKQKKYKFKMEYE